MRFLEWRFEMTREKVEDTLLAMGVPAWVRGFAYITDAIEIFEKRGIDVYFTKDLYSSIAQRRKTTSSRVERAIRNAFDIARSCKGDYEIVNKYIGFMHSANSHSLKQLYMMLKREETE